MDALYCAFCLVVRKNDLKRAVTICNGQACCFDHLYYVQGGDYNQILAIIKNDEERKKQGIDIKPGEVAFIEVPKKLKKIFRS